jgi:class 3 adenylate cyclase
VRAIGIQVRVGLHTGEIQLHGDDIGGIAVHIAQRVQALAQPDGVLVSRTIADLVRGSGIAFGDRGIHTLKGVPDPSATFTSKGKPSGPFRVQARVSAAKWVERLIPGFGELWTDTKSRWDR